MTSLPMLGLLVTTLLTWEDNLKAKIARQWRHSVCCPLDGGGTLFRSCLATLWGISIILTLFVVTYLLGAQVICRM